MLFDEIRIGIQGKIGLCNIHSTEYYFIFRNLAQLCDLQVQYISSLDFVTRLCKLLYRKTDA